MRFVSLFAGVGGFDLGFERAGWTCVGQVEIDKHARAVLDRHWPNVPKHDDVTTAMGWADDIDLVGRVDIVCGGFPCQPFSVAGKRLGRDDLRGNLFWNALEFAKHIQAPHLILENVPGLLSQSQGSTFGEIISDLAEAGFTHVEWRVLDSQFFGVPQRRKRVWIVASADPAAFGGRAVLVEREGVRWDLAQSGTAGQAPAGTAAGSTAGSGAGVADSLSLSLSLSGEQRHDAGSSQHCDDRHGCAVRPGHGVASSHAVGQVIGTLSGGAHPGGFNGQDAYSNQLVVVREEQACADGQ